MKLATRATRYKRFLTGRRFTVPCRAGLSHATTASRRCTPLAATASASDCAAPRACPEVAIGRSRVWPVLGRHADGTTGLLQEQRTVSVAAEHFGPRTRGRVTPARSGGGNVGRRRG